MKAKITIVENLDEQIFDDTFLQCGDVIKKANGDEFIVTEQTIDHYTIRHCFRPTEVIKCVSTKLKKISTNKVQKADLNFERNKV